MQVRKCLIDLSFAPISVISAASYFLPYPLVIFLLV